LPVLQLQPAGTSARSLPARIFLPQSPAALLVRAVAAAFLIRMVIVALVFRDLPDPAHNFEQFGWELAWTARTIALGHGFGSPFWPLTGPTALVPPGYPYLLAAIFRLFGLFSLHSAFVILTLQALVSALTCVPIYAIAKRAATPRIANFAAWAWVIYPFSIYYSTIVWEWALTAFLFTACLAIMLRLHTVERTSLWIAFGLLYGLTALVNPAVLSVQPFLFAVVLLKRARDRRPWLLKGTLTTLTIVAVLAPWTLRTYRTMHVLVPIRDNFWLEIYAGNTGDTFESNVAWAHPASNPAEMQAYERMGEIPYLAQKHALAADFVTHHPAWFAVATLRRFIRYWTGFWSFSRRYLHKEPLDVPNVFFCTTVTLLMLRGLFRLWRSGRSQTLQGKALHVEVPSRKLTFRKVLANPALPFALLLAVFPITYYLSHASMDYRQPIEPVIVILVIIGIFSLRAANQATESGRSMSRL
jgi:hypothetical protein